MGSQMRKWLLLAFLFVAGSGQQNIKTPSAGQWIDFGATEPTISGNSFAFPTNSNSTAVYFYTKLPALVGQTLTLVYTIVGNNPQWAQSPHTPQDTNPA